jgi:hypothetical protein
MPCDEATTPGHLPAQDFDALAVLSDGMQRLLAQSSLAAQEAAVSSALAPPSAELPPCVREPLLPQATTSRRAVGKIAILRMDE